MEAVVQLERRAEPLEREEVRVDTTASDDVAARRRQLDVRRSARAAAPASRIDARIFRHSSGSRFADSTVLRVNAQRVALGPLDVDADRRDQLDERLDVANARHVFEDDRMLGEQRRADDRQRGVLVARRPDGAGQLLSSLDDELQCAHVRAVRSEWSMGAKNERVASGQWRGHLRSAGAVTRALDTRRARRG